MACVMPLPVFSPLREHWPIATIHLLLPFNDHFRNFIFLLRALIRSAHVFTCTKCRRKQGWKAVNHVLISAHLLSIQRPRSNVKRCFHRAPVPCPNPLLLCCLLYLRSMNLGLMIPLTVSPPTICHMQVHAINKSNSGYWGERVSILYL